MNRASSMSDVDGIWLLSTVESDIHRPLDWVRLEMHGHAQIQIHLFLVDSLIKEHRLNHDEDDTVVPLVQSGYIGQ